MTVAGQAARGFLALNGGLLTVNLEKSHRPARLRQPFSCYSVSIVLEFWPQPFCSICMPYLLHFASFYSSLKTPAPTLLLLEAISDPLRSVSISLWASVALSLSGPAMTTGASSVAVHSG